MNFEVKYKIAEILEKNIDSIKESVYIDIMNQLKEIKDFYSPFDRRLELGHLTKEDYIALGFEGCPEIFIKKEGKEILRHSLAGRKIIDKKLISQKKTELLSKPDLEPNEVAILRMMLPFLLDD